MLGCIESYAKVSILGEGRGKGAPPLAPAKAVSHPLPPLTPPSFPPPFLVIPATPSAIPASPSVIPATPSVILTTSVIPA